jgi:hypothetical protein
VNEFACFNFKTQVWVFNSGWIDDCAKCEYPVDWGLTKFVLVPRCHIPNFNELFQGLTLKVSNVVRNLPTIY